MNDHVRNLGARLVGLVLLAGCNTEPGSDGPTADTDDSSTDGTSTDGTSTGGTSTSGTSTTGDSTTGDSTTGDPSDECEPGTFDTAWASSCPTTPVDCTPGTWTAPATGSDGQPLQHESEHFAIYYFLSDPDGGGPLQGLSQPLSPAEADATLATLEDVWSEVFGPPILHPEPYCDKTNKRKATVHLDDFYPLWGGGWNCSGETCMGLWIGPGATADPWSLAHEFTHGLQATTAGFPDCGGVACWIYESHANWLAHQIHPDNPHCSEMLVNAPHLYYGHTRDRYCNWQFLEFLKDTECYEAVHAMWTSQANPGNGDPWGKLMASRGWDLDALNDRFGEWAMHNVTFDYQDPPPASKDQGAVYRQNYGPITDTDGPPQRRNRLTRLEPLDDDWASHRRFATPHYQAAQRLGYNIVELVPEADAERVGVRFRGVLQPGSDANWRWGLVATDPTLETPRYSPLQAGSDGELDFCVSPGESLFLVVTATPDAYQKITWEAESDGTPWPAIYRYPWMVEFDGAWPAGFEDGTLADCPAGTAPHSNGGGCVTPGTPDSVYVGPWARVLGGSVSNDAQIEGHATILNGAVVSGGTVGALTTVTDFSVSDDARVESVFYPMGWFGDGQSATGTAWLLGDLEFVASNKSVGVYYGFVDNNWAGVDSVTDLTAHPPYTWWE